MKIIAAVNSNEFLASVSRDEIRKVLDHYYARTELKIEVGTTINLGAGHDFRGQIQEACRGMTDAMRQFERARATLMAFSIMVSNLPPGLQPEAKEGGA